MYQIRVLRVGVLTIVLALLASAALTIRAAADEGAPPPSETPSVTTTDSSGDSSTADTGTGVVPESGSSTSSNSSVSANSTAGTDSTAIIDTGTTSSPDNSGATSTAEPASTESPDNLLATNSSVSSDAAQAESSSIPEAAASDSVADASAPDDLSALPAGSSVVLLDAGGQSVPLATQQAADIVAIGDPMWCPAGVAPGSATCHEFLTLKAMADAVSAGTFSPNANGVIWISSSSENSTSNIVFDGSLSSAWTTWSNYSIWFKGGWQGSYGCSPSCVSTIDTGNPSVIDNTSLSIVNWNADVSLSDIEITGTTGMALDIETTKKITLTRVKVHDNTGSGAYLDNCQASGPACTGSAPVLITNSQFVHNTGGNGLYVLSGGSITLNSVISSKNSSLGAGLYNYQAVTPVGVTLTGLNTWNGGLNYFDNTFSDNTGSTGLEIQSKGPVTISNLTASQNGSYGTWIDNCQWDSSLIPARCTGAGAVGLSGTNIFTGNAAGGLYVYSNGAITGNNLIASSNAGSQGAHLANDLATLAQPVTLTGSSQFKDDNLSGLDIASRGPVTLNNITASGNAGYGASINNCSMSGGICRGTGNLSLAGSNTFENNTSTGLMLTSGGAISLSSVDASWNGSGGFGFGALIDNCNFGGSTCATFKPVTLSGTSVFNGNRNTGLFISSGGALLLSNIQASGNLGSYGADLNNNFSGSSAAVTLTGTNIFNENTGVSAEGLYISSRGAVSLANVTAIGNGDSWGGYGAYIDNSLGGSKPVTLSGINTLNENTNEGLYVDSAGVITISSLTADDNTSSCGADLNTTYSSSSVNSVVFSGTSYFERNGLSGLSVSSHGRVYLYNLHASENGSSGVQVNNTASGAGFPRNVTLAGINVFTDNQASGLVISSYGAISVSNITSLQNGGTTFGYGATLDNGTGATTPNSVTVSGTNVFSGNYSDGLEVTSKGAILLNNITASSNTHGSGAYLTNSLTGAVAGVTLTGTNTFEDNHYDGLNISSFGAITVNNVRANRNGSGWTDHGASLSNSGATSGTPGVILAGINVFNDNYGYGLQVASKGPITASNLTASHNAHGTGASLGNTLGGPTSGITLTGVQVFDGNYSGGLEARSSGPISLMTTSISASQNGNSTSGYGYGLLLDNSGAASGAPGITLKGSNVFDSNWYSGLEARSLGTITLSTTSVTANENGSPTSGYGYGIALDNSGATSGTPGISLTGTNMFNRNYNDGLSVRSKGPISASNVTASDNRFGNGTELYNLDGPATAGITLTGSNAFNENTYSGLIVQSFGPISLSSTSLSANWNGQTAASGYGVEVDNCKNTGSSCTGSAAVTISGINQFNHNYYSGLTVTSGGAISVSNLTANCNGTTTTCATIGISTGNGASLDNSTPLTGTPGVTILGTNALNGNRDAGLRVDSLGAILANNLTASHNRNNSGAVLKNDYLGATAGVTLTGINTFDQNALYGLRIFTNGGASLTRVAAGGNGADGLYVSSPGSVVLTCGSFTNNTLYGLHVVSATSITLSGVTSSGNGSTSDSFSVSPTRVRLCPLP